MIFESRKDYKYFCRFYNSSLSRSKVSYIGIRGIAPDTSEKSSEDHASEIVLVNGGDGILSIGGNETVIHEKDVFVCNRGINYSVCGGSLGIELVILGLEDNKNQSSSGKPLLPAGYDCVFRADRVSIELYRCFETMLSEKKKNDGFSDSVIHNCAALVQMYLYRMIDGTSDSEQLMSNRHILNLAITYIDSHYKEQLSLDSVSSVCYASKYYISHLFTKMMGCSIGCYIIQKRFEEARRLLSETNLTVKEISKEVGFNDAAYFGRIFKSRFNMTPIEYRDSFRRHNYLASSKRKIVH